MSPPASLQEKAVSLKRQHVLEAAIRVFAARGFHRATIREIALEAGVADGTIYSVFENKTALLLGILDARPGEPIVNPDEAPPATPEAMVRRLIERQWHAFTPETLAMLRVILSEVLIDPKLRRIYVERVISPALTLPHSPFNRYVAQGELNSADVAMTIRMMTAAFLGLVMLRLLGDELLEHEADQVPDFLASLLWNGLRPRKAETT